MSDEAAHVGTAAGEGDGVELAEGTVDVPVDTQGIERGVVLQGHGGGGVHIDHGGSGVDSGGEGRGGDDVAVSDLIGRGSRRAEDGLEAGRAVVAQEGVAGGIDVIPGQDAVRSEAGCDVAIHGAGKGRGSRVPGRDLDALHFIVPGVETEESSVRDDAEGATDSGTGEVRHGELNGTVGDTAVDSERRAAREADGTDNLVDGHRGVVLRAEVELATIET